MKRVLITRKINDIAREMLSRHFEVVVNPVDRHLTERELAHAAREFDGILSTIADKFTPSVFEQARRLKVLSNCAKGLDNIDLEAARAHNIVVTNFHDVVSESTADFTFALFLSFIRKIPQAKEYVLQGKWKEYDPSLFLGEELRGKTFGIVGLGLIGSAVASRALAFGLKVIAYDTNPEASLEGVSCVSFDTLLATSDYISLHVPLNQNTRFLIDASAFAKMDRHPILINMARGAVVQTEALVVALETGQIRGAAIDVTDPEPLPKAHPLNGFDNCLIVPHLGAATFECRREMARIAAQNLIDNLAYACLNRQPS